MCQHLAQDWVSLRGHHKGRSAKARAIRPG